MLVLQYHVLSGTFSRETVKMYKNPGDQNIFQKIAWRDILV